MSRIPVSIVTGFLGTGKTTFLNRLIATGALDRAALVINEFGDIGIDHLLIETAEEGIVELSGGCLCCSLRGDLADTLARLVDRDPTPDRIVIETTGLADPGPIAQTVIANSELNQRLELAGILALIDCADGPALLETHEEARLQIALADRILLTKGDVKDQAVGLEGTLRSINPAAVLDGVSDELAVDCLDRTGSASIGSTANSRTLRETPPPPGGEAAEAKLMRVGGQMLRHARSQLPANLPPTRNSHPVSTSPWRGGEANSHVSEKPHTHQTNMKAVALSAPNPAPLSAIELFLDTLITTCGTELLRVKGLVRTAESPDQPLLIQGVAQSFDTPRRLSRWPDGDTTTRLVIIGRDLDEQSIRHLFESMTGRPITDMPDRQALEESPLSVPGFV